MPQRTTKFPPKTLVSLQPVQVFAATFVDGSQFSDTRLVAKIGNHVHFLHPEGVDNKIRQPAGWLRDAVLAQAPAAPEAPVEIPEEAVTELPMGEG